MKSQKTNYAGVIAAAGLSSRMKNYKPLMQLGGRSIICHAVSHFLDAGLKEIVVVTGFRGDELENHLKENLPAQAPVHFVRNENYAENTMFESYHMGMQAVSTKFLPDCDGILLSPADIPFIHPDTIIAVRDCPAAMARPTYHGQYGHPVLISKDVLPKILNYRGDYGLRGAMESAGCEIASIPVDDPWMLLDADTPEDFRKLQSILSEPAQ